MRSFRQLAFYHSPQILFDLLGRYNRLRYGGKTYYCPVCSSNLKSFLPLPHEFSVILEIGGLKYDASNFETLNAEQYLCPVCRCSDRDRLCALFLKRIPDASRKNKKLLHFAPERALLLYLKKSGMYDYRTADLYRENVDDNVDITRMDRYEKDSFDCFICSHVLEHVQEDTRALGELFRILNPSGWGILMVPLIPALAATYEDLSVTTSAERLKHFGQEDHLRVYGKAAFIVTLKRAGFNVSQLGVDFFGADILRRHGIAPKSCLYIVHKTKELMIV